MFSVMLGLLFSQKPNTTPPPSRSPNSKSTTTPNEPTHNSKSPLLSWSQLPLIYKQKKTLEWQFSGDRGSPSIFVKLKLVDQ